MKNKEQFCDWCYQPILECICPKSQEEYENMIKKRKNKNRTKKLERIIK